MDKTKYLRIIGRLLPDNRLQLIPGYLTDKPRKLKEDPGSPLVAELFNKEGKILLTYHVPARRYCVDGRTLPELAVRGEIPFPADTSLIRFFRGKVQIHEIVVSDRKPEVKIHWKPPKIAEGKQKITWEGRHPSKKPLQYFLRFTHDGKNWQRVGWRTEKTVQETDFAQLPGGKKCRIAVVATDGVNTVQESSKVFSVPIKSCKAMILVPEDGATFAPTELIILHGQGFYLEENKPETKALTWDSSKDGKLGTGMSLSIKRLSVGSHVIKLTAGTKKRKGQASISIQIREK